MTSKKLAALDIGTVRIGIAVSDESQTIAMPYGTVKASEDPIKTIGNILKSENIQKVVVGWPFNLDGSEGVAIRRTKQFLVKFKKEYPEIRIVPQDERLTSVAAENALQEMNTQGSKKKNVVDAMAACMILQMYMDRVRG